MRINRTTKIISEKQKQRKLGKWKREGIKKERKKEINK
jgi:hypothetical protein